jgi:hypothetical protein
MRGGKDNGIVAELLPEALRCLQEFALQRAVTGHALLVRR